MRVTERLAVEAAGFAKRLDDLARAIPSLTPAAGRVLDRRRARARRRGPGPGAGRRPARPVGWLAYTLGRSERQDGPGADWRLADFDQTHVLALVLGYQRGPWDAGGRLATPPGRRGRP